MLRAGQLNGFGTRLQIPTLRQADFLYLPTSSRVATDGTGGFPDIGGNVGTVVNRGTLGGSVNATSNSNRALLQSVGVGRLAVRGLADTRMPQLFTSFTGSTIYTISAFIPKSSTVRSERIACVSLNASTADFDNTSGACLLLREDNTNNWGVYRNLGFRGTIAATNGVLTIFETVVAPTEARVSKDGAADLVTSYGSMGNFNASSLRFLSSHGYFGDYEVPSSDTDVIVAAVFFSNPTAAFRARALAEVRTIAGIATP